MKSNIFGKLIRCGSAALCALVLFSAPISHAQDEAANPADAGAVTNTAASEAVTNDTVAEVNEDVKPAPERTEPARDNKPDNRRLGDLVVFGRNVEVKAGETANDVVVFFGTATVRGEAKDAVAILGSIVVDGGKTKDAVAIMGNVKVGTNSSVNGDAVAVMGNIKISPGGNVRGDTVAVGGAVQKADGANVGGDVVGLPGFSWIGDYLEQCVYKLRPLAPQLGWLWVLTGVFFMLYLLVAVAFPRPVNACVEEISRRPATTFLIGLMTKFLLLPVVTLILVITGIGVFLIPFLFAAVTFAAIVGKVAFLQYLGLQFGRQSGVTMLQKPIMAFVFGWIIITLLYLVPIVGFIVFGVTGVWALGAAAMAMFGGARREMADRPASPPSQATLGATQPAAAAFAANATVASVVTAAPDATVQEQAAGPTPVAAEAGWSPTPMAAAPGAPMSAAEALALPRASFWERMAAAFLDVILVSILGGLVGSAPLGFLVALAYFAGMWTWRGTTIGGIVLNLKVVRYDGQPMNFAVALVRALMAAFSVVVLFLGFLWIAFDRDKQAWHDKIAGTVVVRQPRGMPLLCL